MRKKNMRILFIAASMSYGGAERVISLLSNELSARGHEVAIYVTKPTTQSVYPLDSSVKLCSEKKIGSMTDVLKNIRIFVKKFDPDVVVPFMTYQCIYTMLALAFTKYPVVVCERNDPHLVDGVRPGKLHYILRDIAFQMSKGAVFQTDGAKEYFPSSIQKKSTVILNPLCEKDLLDVYEGERENRIVNVGRLSKQKNQALLISAFSDIAQDFPEMVLEIYGDGEEKEYLQRLASDLNVADRVHFMGTVKGVSQHIKNAKIFAFTSDHEGMPNALAEAMSLGLACVSTDCSPGGARMIIDDNVNGRLVNIGDRKAFADALRDLCSNDEYARKLGDEAVLIRDKLRLDKIVDNWEDYLSSLALKQKR